MKKYIIPILLALLPLTVKAGIATNAVPITFTWTNPNATTDLVFVLHHSVNVSVPMASWQVISNFPYTGTNITLSIQPGEHYYYITASNFWGETDPSNVIQLPAVPLSGVMSVRKGN